MTARFALFRQLRWDCGVKRRAKFSVAIQRYRRVERRPMPEEVCAESNQILFDYHIPQAASLDF